MIKINIQIIINIKNNFFQVYIKIHKGEVKSGRIKRPSNKEKKLFEKFQNVNNNIWNNNLNYYNFQSNIQQYEVNKLKNDSILPPIHIPIPNKCNNIFNGNKTFTTFSNINGININDI